MYALCIQIIDVGPSLLITIDFELCITGQPHDTNGGFYLPPKTKAPITRAQGATGYRLCVYASGSLITDIFCFLTHISVSCLHFGQYKGKFSRTVSRRIFILVLFSQTGHSTHLSCNAITSVFQNMLQKRTVI